MSERSQSSVVLELTEKLAAVEKRLAELELKHSGAPLTATLVSQQGENEEKKRKSEMKVQKSDLRRLLAELEEQEQGHDPRVKIIVSRRNPETGEPIEQKVSLKTQKQEDRESIAFVLRKKVYDAKYHAYFQLQDSSEIEIISLGLWNLLKEHLGDYPYHIFRDSPVTLVSPYEAIVFQFDKLRAVSAESAKDDEDMLARADLGRLLNAIFGGASGDENLDKYFKMRPTYKKPSHENQSEPETITFMDLWTVFPPGTLIYGQPFQDEHQVFIVKSNVTVWPYKDTERSDGRDYHPWKLHVWSYDWKDGAFRRTDFTLLFEQFDGHLPLTSLNYYPFELHGNYTQVRKGLIERGKDFRKYCEAKQGKRLFEYKGKALSEKSGFSNMRQDSEAGSGGDTRARSSYDLPEIFARIALGARRHAGSAAAGQYTDIQGRVMVDYESYFQFGPADGRNGLLEPANAGPGCACSDCQSNEGLMKNYRTRFDKPKSEEWEEEQYLICPPRVLGYILKDKKWAQLQVTYLSSINENESETNALDERLKLADDDEFTRQGKRGISRDTSTKGLLLDLVKSHTSSTSGDGIEDRRGDLEVEDIVPGKGKGLVILFYGPPGVGKTSTAETIATATRKPLFSISVADVGTQARHVESNLSRIFSLATKWEAILLLDEADVFLESRGRGTKIQSTDKNALVSVFLRVLEYYQGIMILTTNQIANFDIAIPSRIHVAIKYESLNKKQMQNIFEEFLGKLDNRQLIEDYEGIKHWLKASVYREGFDGRQIRNIVTTALGLARAEKNDGGRRKLTQDHMRRAFEIASDFKQDFATQMQRYKDSQDLSRR